MIGSWQPSNTENKNIEPSLLAQLLNQLSELENNLANIQLQPSLSGFLLEASASWIEQNQDTWNMATAELKDEEIWLLAKFYALAEEQIDEFSAQEKSPAIALFKILKKRGANLNKSHTQELKSLSSNRYIPFGKAIF